MNEPFNSRFPLLQEHVRQLLAEMPHCHGWDHTVRVWHNARHIARAENADLAVVQYAALLHDIGRAAELADEGLSCHARLGAEQVPHILNQIGINEREFISRVQDCVRLHRYRRRDAAAPASLEAKTVYDADKLDSMGAIGLARAFHFAGRIGARVHNTAEEALAADSYSQQDTAYREYLVKLKDLHAAMLTDEGRRMAAARHRFMTRFFRRLEQEIAGEDS